MLCGEGESRLCAASENGLREGGETRPRAAQTASPYMQRSPEKQVDESAKKEELSPTGMASKVNADVQGLAAMCPQGDGIPPAIWNRLAIWGSPPTVCDSMLASDISTPSLQDIDACGCLSDCRLSGMGMPVCRWDHSKHTVGMIAIVIN